MPMSMIAVMTMFMIFVMTMLKGKGGNTKMIIENGNDGLRVIVAMEAKTMRV